MCGIVAAIAERSVQSILIEGLKRLEYRGYDSAGVALVHSGQIECTRARARSLSWRNWYLIPKRVRVLLTLGGLPWSSQCPKCAPQCSEDSRSYTTALLKITRPSKNSPRIAWLCFRIGHRTKTIAHLLHLASQTEESFDSIVDSVISQLDGAFALAIIDEQTPDVIWAADKAARW